MGFMLDDKAPLHIFFPVTDTFVQMLIHGFNDHWFAGLIQRYSLFLAVKIIIFHLSTRKKMDGCLLAVNPEGFNQVEHQRLFVVIVRVQEPHIRIKT